MLDGGGDLDILALLQLLLTLDKVVDTIDDQLHQFHLVKKSRVTPESYACKSPRKSPTHWLE